MKRTDPDICARCASQGPTCCALSPGDEQFCFPLSNADRARILTAGFPETTMVQAPNSLDFVEQLARLLPEYDVATVFASTGSHWRLTTSCTGHCVFLNEHGCCLDQSLRPSYCRLFPFWIYQGRLTWFVAEDCLATQTWNQAPAMFHALNTDATTVRSLFATLCADLGLVLG